jgi:hypothetical protein
MKICSGSGSETEQIPEIGARHPMWTRVSFAGIGAVRFESQLPCRHCYPRHGQRIPFWLNRSGSPEPRKHKLQFLCLL